MHIMEGWLLTFDSMCSRPESRVSAHAGVGRDGAVHRYVEWWEAAWHAGEVNRPTWLGLVPGVNPNLYTIGIEFEGFSRDGYTAEQQQSGVWLLRQIWRDCGIEPTAATVVRHSAINALHAGCPGPLAPIEEMADEAHRLGPLGVGG